MKLVNTFLFFLFCVAGFQLHGQERYLQEVFSGFNVQKDIKYGTNISVITGAPAPQDLLLDVYTPAGDTKTNRPVVVVLHTGSFVPPVFFSITGSRSDSAVVENCRRLARMGYVAVAATYRLGWRPDAVDQDVRTNTLLNAAYRGIQDARTVVRFLRKSVAEAGNPYGIDPSKIVLWGHGTGGYLSLGAAYLDRFKEEVVLEKFIDTKTLKPYVDTTLNGNLYGTTTTPLCLANHPGYSSDFALSVNMGGALGDLGWLEGKAGEIPTIGFHVLTDPFAPYADGPVIVPTTGDFVVNVSGTYSVVKKANDKGINAVFETVNKDLTNPITARMKAYGQIPITYRGQTITYGTDNMYPFNPTSTLTPYQSGPWEWWSKPQLDAVVAGTNAFLGTKFNSDTLHINGLKTNPDMSKAKAMAYLDTIFGLTIPRMYLALNLATSVKEVISAQTVELTISPNPVSDVAFLKSSEQSPMQDIGVYNLEGKLVKGVLDLNSSYYELSRSNLPPGIYVVQVRFKQGIVAQKLVLQ